MQIPSLVAPTTISKIDSLIWSKVGLMIYSSFSKATLTAATGPLKGMSEIITAANAPIIPNISGGLILSVDTTVGTTCNSLLKAL